MFSVAASSGLSGSSRWLSENVAFSELLQKSKVSMSSSQVTPEGFLHYLIKTPNLRIERLRENIPGWIDRSMENSSSGIFDWSKKL